MWGVREPEASITKRACRVVPDAQHTLVVAPFTSTRSAVS